MLPRDAKQNILNSLSIFTLLFTNHNLYVLYAEYVFANAEPIVHCASSRCLHPSTQRIHILTYERGSKTKLFYSFFVVWKGFGLQKIRSIEASITYFNNKQLWQKNGLTEQKEIVLLVRCLYSAFMITIIQKKNNRTRHRNNRLLWSYPIRKQH